MPLLGQHPESMCYYGSSFMVMNALIESLHKHAQANSDIPQCPSAFYDCDTYSVALLYICTFVHATF